MKKIITISFILLLTLAIVVQLKNLVRHSSETIEKPIPKEKIPEIIEKKVSLETAIEPSFFANPIEKPEARITKKKFGDFITPENSPIQPERFSGFHTGVDFEIFPEELDQEIPIKAICSGTIKIKGVASGYGGLIVQECFWEDSPISVIYGHLGFKGSTKTKGDSLQKGEEIGILGHDHSQETDGERKHLHLGIHKGSKINILGYVQSEKELKDWIDPCLFICK